MSVCIKLILLLFAIIIIKNLSYVSNGKNLRRAPIEQPNIKNILATPTKDLLTSSNKNVKQLDSFISSRDLKNLKKIKEIKYTNKPIPEINFYADDDNDTFYYLRHTKKAKY